MSRNDVAEAPQSDGRAGDVMRRVGLLLLISLLITSPARAAESAIAKTSAGDPVRVLVDLPQGAGPFPVVVYANGQGGDVRGNLPSAIAQAVVGRGAAVLRFDWRYRTADPEKGVPSPTLANEVADFDAAIAFAKHDARFKGQPVVLMGKSLGSVVAARVLSLHPDVVGAVFLTPVCSLHPRAGDPEWVSDPYPRLTAETRPAAFVVGDADPLCAIPSLYGFALKMARSPRIAVVDGDHGFLNAKQPSSNGPNVQFAAENAAAAATAVMRASAAN